MKRNTSQYQKIISAVFIKNAYDQSQITNNTTTTNTIVGIPDKFALRVFNRLAYN